MDSTAFHVALQAFATAVTRKSTQVVSGDPEDQVRGPFEVLMNAAADVFGWDIVCTGETRLPERIGRPDYAVHLNRLLTGYVELKAPGIGATASRFKGRNRDQFNRFSVVPNVLYTDGIEWAVYRDGQLYDQVVRLSGDVATEGSNAVTIQNSQNLQRLLHVFLLWEPLIPTDASGAVDLKGFAALLAPLCRILRNDVTDALEQPDSPLIQLAHDWRQLLFPNASDYQFADAYAQTVTFALLLGRSEGTSEALTLESAEAELATQHNLLARALHVLTDSSVRSEIGPSIDLLVRVIAEVPPALVTAPGADPWLYFYEDFLAVYDPELRDKAGVYYTPVEVVHFQVRLIDDLLTHRLGKPLGFADPDVVTLDPAVGTGTYLVGVIEHALGRIQGEQGPGAVPGQASTLASNLFGFEQIVGAYAVAELRVSRALLDRGAELPGDGTHIYLTDTLESPNAKPPQTPLFLRPIAEQHARALQVKGSVPVIVCLGNPPYDRHEAATPNNRAQTGGWVRWGADGDPAILDDFISPLIDAGMGVHVKNLYNLYVYFWRWALWKVFEYQSNRDPGIISFISASSYVDGPAFGGMRAHLRRQSSEVWILDLGGEGRGARTSENVFAIQTPVAIAVAMRTQDTQQDTPAAVYYARIEGNRREKLAILNKIGSVSDVKWQECPEEWQAPFRPAGRGVYFDWPLLADLMPWQHSGSQLKRTWPIAPDLDTLNRRWHGLLQADDRSTAFRETRDRTVNSKCRSLFGTNEAKETSVAELGTNAPVPRATRYAYRSFDRQWVLADTRLGDYLRPDLWRTHGDSQVYLSTLLQGGMSTGPALTSAAFIPDLHHFCNRGAKDTIPLYRNAEASEANIIPGLLDTLGAVYQRSVLTEDFLAYLYGVLAQPAFTKRFSSELETRDLRVPITKNPDLFERIRTIGARLVWLHTFGERFLPEGAQRGRVPVGKARCTEAVPTNGDGYPDLFRYVADTETINVGNGAFAPVAQEVYEFKVSGLKVVQSWLSYRMRSGAGRKSSPLDNIRPERWTSVFTTEFLELLWVLEATVAGYSEQKELLEAILGDVLFEAKELPHVSDDQRKPPKARKDDAQVTHA